MHLMHNKYASLLFSFISSNTDLSHLYSPSQRPVSRGPRYYKTHCTQFGTSAEESIKFVQLVNYPELDPKIIRRIVNMRIKGYSQLIDIVNFCGKQGNISSSKKTHGSGLLSVVKRSWFHYKIK